MYVYLVQNENDHIKVGITSNLHKRVPSIQTGSSTQLELIGYVQVGTREEALALEKDIHRHFTSDRLKGEWFSVSRFAIEKYIRRTHEVVIGIPNNAMISLLPDGMHILYGNGKEFTHYVEQTLPRLYDKQRIPNDKQ